MIAIAIGTVFSYLMFDPLELINQREMKQCRNTVGTTVYSSFL